jgi:hypothetical protein
MLDWSVYVSIGYLTDRKERTKKEKKTQLKKNIHSLFRMSFSPGYKVYDLIQ